MKKKREPQHFASLPSNTQPHANQDGARQVATLAQVQPGNEYDTSEGMVIVATKLQIARAHAAGTFEEPLGCEQHTAIQPHTRRF